MDAYGEAEAYLQRRVPELLGGNLCAVQSIASGVWSLRVGAVQRVAKYQPFALLTRGKRFDVLHVERQVLNALAEAGCRVPRLIALDEEAFFAFYEWVGNETLDDWAQRSSSGGVKLIDGLLRNQRAIDEVLARQSDRWAACVAPGGDVASLTDRWASACQRAVWGAEALLSRVGRSSMNADIGSLIGRIGAELALRSPALGSSDYNARNVVISPHGEAFFIEFSKLSWDWTERRLVQYTTCMGSRRDRGVMRCLLDARAARLYVKLQGSEALRALDGHQVIFLLNAAANLCAALDRPTEPANAALLRAWQNPPQRLQVLADALGTPLSNDEQTGSIRAVFALHKREEQQ